MVGAKTRVTGWRSTAALKGISFHDLESRGFMMDGLKNRLSKRIVFFPDFLTVASGRPRYCRSPDKGWSLSWKWMRLIVSPPVPQCTSEPRGMPRNHSLPVA